MGCQAFYLFCHPSINPEILFLFSYEKFGAISLLLFAAFLSFSYAKKQKLIIRESFDFPYNKKVIHDPTGFESPYFITLSIILFVYLMNINTGFSAGVDFATQLKATLQWNEDFTDKWNHLVRTEISSQGNDEEMWLFRPPGALLFYVPFLELPIPFGESLRLAQLSLCLIICFSWIKVTKILCLSTSLQMLLGIILALWVCNGLSYVGNVQTLVTAYSSLCALLYLLVFLKIKSHENFKYRYILVLGTLSVISGCVVFLKVSAILFNSLLVISFGGIMLTKNFKRLPISLTFAASFFLFCIPYWFLKNINSTYGINLNDVYHQDYNNQWLTQELWGQYFTETTQMPAVILSLLASFSTFSPFHLSQTLLTNFLTFTGWFDNMILSFEVNQKVIYKGLVGVVFSLIQVFYFMNYSFLTKSLKYYCIAALLCPFFIFTYLSNKHGYNYLITGTYSQQFIPLFCLLILWLTFNYWESKKKFSAYVITFLFFSIGIFTFSNLSGLGQTAKNRFSNERLSTNHFKHLFYGKDIRLVEDIISEIRTSHHIPIIYLGNSSIEELSIVFPGNYSGISNISSALQNNRFSIPNITYEAIIVIDARLNIQELESINSMIHSHKSSYLLDLHGTAKVIHVKG
jgi:hypothetical protein